MPEAPGAMLEEDAGMSVVLEGWSGDGVAWSGTPIPGSRKEKQGGGGLHSYLGEISQVKRKLFIINGLRARAFFHVH